MTFPRAERDLLIFLASSSTDPSAPVLLTCERERATERSREREREEILYHSQIYFVVLLLLCQGF